MTARIWRLTFFLALPCPAEEPRPRGVTWKCAGAGLSAIYFLPFLPHEMSLEPE